MFKYLEENPIIDIGKTADDFGLAFSTVSTSVKKINTSRNTCTNK